MKKIYDSHKYIFHGLILALVPVVSCLLVTLIQGGSLGKVYLGASEWNDELFYYKQVEEMVTSQIPRGYFGYNESAAACLSFGAWSPVILLPWALFGKLFSWNMYSPFIANILYLSLALLGFGVLAKPDFRKTVTGSGLLLLFTPMARYMLSAMPEVIITAMIIVYAGLIIGYERSTKKGARMVFTILILFLLTIVRPYFAVLFLPVFLMGTKRIKLVSVFTAPGSVVVYFMISKFLCAPYFTDLFSMEWLKVFSREGFLAGIAFFFKTIGHYIYSVAAASVKGFTAGYGIGVYFALFLILMAVLLIECFEMRKTEKKKALLLLSVFISEAVFFFALILMYSLGDGFRHLFAFIVLTILISVMHSTQKYPVKEGILAVLIIWLFIVKARDAYYFGIPFDKSGRVERSEITALKEELGKKIEPTKEYSFDNDMILVLSDEEEGVTEVMTWQYGYAAPAGISFSICTAEYVLDNPLKSRYIMTPTRGRVNEECVERGYELISRNEQITIYRTK